MELIYSYVYCKATKLNIQVFASLDIPTEYSDLREGLEKRLVDEVISCLEDEIIWSQVSIGSISTLKP